MKGKPFIRKAAKRPAAAFKGAAVMFRKYWPVFVSERGRGCRGKPSTPSTVNIQILNHLKLRGQMCSGWKISFWMYRTVQKS